MCACVCDLLTDRMRPSISVTRSISSETTGSYGKGRKRSVPRFFTMCIGYSIVQTKYQLRFAYTLPINIRFILMRIPLSLTSKISYLKKCKYLQSILNNIFNITYFKIKTCSILPSQNTLNPFLIYINFSQSLQKL